jgi:hypothetical protein
MVKFLIPLLLISFTAIAETDTQKESKFSADKLKKLFNANESELKSASDRLKASRTSSSNLKLLMSDNIYFKLPNGDYVKGTLLPNGQKAPLYQDKIGDHPACVTSSFGLVKGVWNTVTETIDCELQQHDLAKIKGQSAFKEPEIKRVLPDGSINPDYKKSLPDIKRVLPDGSIDPNYKKSLPDIKPNANEKKSLPTGEQSNVVVVDPNLYVPPIYSGNNVRSIGAVLDDDQPDVYGINIGTWTKCQLKRSVSSSDTGFMDVVLMEEVVGKYKTIPKNSILFANKRINEANETLEATITKALTPDDIEINSINAMLFSIDKTAGLKGELIRHRTEEVQSTLGKSILTGVGGAIPSSTGIVTGTLADFSGKMLETEQSNLTQAPDASVRVDPQNCLLQITKSF